MIDITLFTTDGEILFVHTSRHNTFRKTFLLAVKKGVNLKKLDAQNQDLSGIDLSNVELSSGDFTNTDFSHAVFFNVDFSRAKCKNTNFEGAKLNQVKMIDTQAPCADFCATEITSSALTINAKNAEFRGAYIEDSNLEDSYFRYATFSYATITNTILSDSILTNAVFTDTKLYNVNLDGEIICHPPMTLTYDKYYILITKARMKIGCQQKTHEEWKHVTNKEIIKMDPGSIDSWITMRTALFDLCAAYVALIAEETS